MSQQEGGRRYKDKRSPSTSAFSAPQEGIFQTLSLLSSLQRAEVARGGEAQGLKGSCTKRDVEKYNRGGRRYTQCPKKELLVSFREPQRETSARKKGC